MFTKLFQTVFGSSNDRIVKKLKPTVDAINGFESALKSLGDDGLKAQTPKLQGRLAAGETLDDILPEAFATVREASRRVLGQRHYDVQMMAGISLHQGNVIEMATGEGKTLAATLPAYLHGLTGKGVHVVTVNDYLASRDAAWMGRVYGFLGLTTGCIVHELDDEDRMAAYGADITYGTNNEIGFDYLRDNMKFRLEARVQRPFYFAIVDEVDSILIDEARTPLIISGPAEDSSDLYVTVNQLMGHLTPEDYEKDEKSKSVTLTEIGAEKFENLLSDAGLSKGGSLYDVHNISLVHHLNQALKAHVIFQKDVDYMIKDDKIMIIDEFTGRMMEGRRYSDGLHQALEAKEHVTIQNENQTLASITYQNLFRLYPTLSGMTGTAKTEAAEFSDIYKLEVISIPTNVPVGRVDKDDEVYRTADEKYTAILTLIKECQQKGQPVLVGTVSIEKSEYLSELMRKDGIPHQVLNARYHEQEAMIIADAGSPGAVTIATNMAGRGTDIKLGGNLEMRLSTELAGLSDDERAQKETAIRAEIAILEEQVKKAGGLFVIGTERHESRRIDNQLRGRSGRQGDPGASQFFLSLQDDLMRIFGSDKLDSMLVKLGLKPGEAITHPWINRALERSQQKVEGMNYEYRKNVLKYDDVMNDQRKIIYEQRRDIMEMDDTAQTIAAMTADMMDQLIQIHIPENAYADQWDSNGMHEECMRLFDLNLPIADWAQEEGIADQEIRARIDDALRNKRLSQETKYTPELLTAAEKSILLRLLDDAWKEHLYHLDHLRRGINLRAYAQRDPLNEYKQEAFGLFQEMLVEVRQSVLAAVYRLQLFSQSSEAIFADTFEDRVLDANNWQEEHGILPADDIIAENPPLKAKKPKALKKETPGSDASDSTRAGALSPKKPKVVLDSSVAIQTNPYDGTNRNAACPCGSGKRYKHCHGETV